MANARLVVAPLLPELVPVPHTPQSGICDTCRSSATESFQRCRPCSDASILLPPPVLPVTMSIAGGVVHHHLRTYKDAFDGGARDQATNRLAALLALFLRAHRDCVGEFDVAVCVPSARRVAMRAVVDRLSSLQGRIVDALADTSEANPRCADPDRFTVLDRSLVEGQRVLLVDDTFTTGGSLFSAAHTLRTAGATIVGPVVIGRHVNPDYPPSELMLEWLGDRPWAEDRCGRCDGQRRDETALF